MIAADRVEGRSAKLLAIDANGALRHLPRAALASIFSPGDLVVANDAATLPASLKGVHYPAASQSKSVLPHGYPPVTRRSS